MSRTGSHEDPARELPSVALAPGLGGGGSGSGGRGRVVQGGGAGGGSGGDSLQDLLEGRRRYPGAPAPGPVAPAPPLGPSRAGGLAGARKGPSPGRDRHGAGPPERGGGGGQLDFDEEARKLWARLNLDPSNINQGPYNALDALWRHPQTGATFYVGNQTAAANLQLLEKYKVTHVVNCTDNMPLYHEGSGRISYLRFDITSHYRKVRTDDHAVDFVLPMLEFVSNALADGITRHGDVLPRALTAQGKNVMVHCLAGAHRAGTTGCICLMYFAKLSRNEAVPIAKHLRPIIDPIGDFPELMAKLERGWQKRGRPQLRC